MENNITKSGMDEFCGSTFWDLNVTWYTEDPDLTPCFQKTVLVWTPCAFLWVFTLLEVYYIVKSKERNIPWNVLSISKLFGTSILIVLTLVDLGVTVHKSSLGQDTFNVDYYTPIIKIASFCLSATLLYYNRKYGLRSSGLLFFFWFFFTLTGLVQFRAEIMTHKESDSEDILYSFVSYMIFYPLLILMFLLNCFADLPPKDSPYKDSRNPCPERGSSFPSRLTFAWFDPLAWTGFRRSLIADDLWDLLPQDSALEVVPVFDKYWKKSLAKSSNVPNAKASFRKGAGSVDFANTKSVKPASVLPAICKAFGPTFLFGSALKLLNDLLMFVSPQLLKYLISFVEGNEPLWRGYFYALLLLLTAMIQTIILAQYFTIMYVVGLRIRTALISSVYRKALRMSNAARKESTVGEIVNLMSVDAQRFMDLTAYLSMIWSAPLQIGLALYFLWEILGPAVLAGLAIMIVLIPVNGFIANRVKTLQIQQMKYKDERVKLMNEVLNGIKVLKLYAWEPSFESQILKIRENELHVLKLSAYLNAATSFIWSCAPFLVSLVTFATYVLIDEKNVLDSTTAFVSLSLFNILRFPLSMLPTMITNLIQTSVSIKRINKFMNCDELEPDSVQHHTSEVNPLVMENGRFSWGDNESTLKNINISIPSGSLVAVVGTVGSGKSSLLSAFLGEMDKQSGRINTIGSIAYVAQQAWIQNATLRDNILFGKSHDKFNYANVVEACALKPDLEMLPAGDQTEIGEKGINLSGGQKQRVSLARAVYCDSDIYFLDDPLSAVDSHVGKHIFEKVIGRQGLLRGKTRILVTHGITYLPEADSIIVLKDGEVSESGTYQQLLDKKGAFADFLLHHLSDMGQQEQPDLDEIKQQLENSLGSEFRDKLQRARSLSESTSETEHNRSMEKFDRQTSVKLDRQTSVKGRTPEKTPDGNLQLSEKKDKLIEAEKAETGSVKWDVYKHYLGSIGLLLSILTLVMNMVFQGFSIGSNVWLSVWADDKNLVVNNTVDRPKQDLYLGVYGALGLGQVVTVSLSSLALYIGCVSAARILHVYMLKHVLRAPSSSFFDVTPVGRILNRFAKDVDTLDNVLPMTLRGWTSCLFSVIATIVVISYSTPIFMAVIFPIGAIYYFIQKFYVATSRQLKRLESVSRSPIYSHFGESVSGASTIRAYGVQNRFIAESESKVDYNQVCYYPSCIANRWLAVRLEMIGNLIIFFAALFAVQGKETMNAGLVGLSISYALQVTQTLNWLVRMTSEVETNIVAVERIKEYGETEQEAPWQISSNAPKPDWPDKGAVRFESLVLGYRKGDEPALKGVSCDLRGGERVGIVGRTGAGKSTLTLGLFRIIEALGGRIVIDDVDIAKIGLHQLRTRITIIPQDPVLFSGTLRMNLDPFDAYSDEQLWKSLELAHLKAFVKGLSAGLGHAVTEGGENLSVGQRQLICLARAVLRKTRVLVLDEATAAVDLETDELIQNTIRTEFNNCTVLTIAHRLNTIMDSDRVMVLDKGKLVEFSAPQDLLKDKKSIFYGMSKDAGLVN